MQSSKKPVQDPNYDQILKNEVLYLHSLWHQGPPRNRKRNPNPKSTHNSLSITDSPLLNKRKRVGLSKRGRKDKKKKLSESDPPRDSGPEWPCPEPVKTPDHTTSGWPAIAPMPAPVTQPVSAEDRANLVVKHLQYKMFDACREFLCGNSDSEGNGHDESGEEEEEVGDDNDCDRSEGNEEYKFFLRMFMENNYLRGYYERNYENGFFCCLVCGGIGKKNAGKRFKKGLGLVQHSIAISKTKKRRAHKAFGKVICAVLGWDFDRLPVVVLKGEPLGRSLASSSNLGEEHEANTDGNNHDSGFLNENAVSLSMNDGQKDDEITKNGNDGVLVGERIDGDWLERGENLIINEHSLKEEDGNNLSPKDDEKFVNGNDGLIVGEKIAEDPPVYSDKLVIDEVESLENEIADDPVNDLDVAEKKCENSTAEGINEQEVSEN